MYIRFKKGKFARNKEIVEGIILDIGKNNELLGIEILEVSSRYSPKDVGQIDVRFPLHLVKA